MIAEPESLTRRIGILSAVFMIITGVITLSLWFFGFYQTNPPLLGGSPISPVAAVAYLLLAAIILILIIPLRQIRARTAAKVMTIITMIVSFIFWVAQIFAPELDPQHLLLDLFFNNANLLNTQISSLAALSVSLATIAMLIVMFGKMENRYLGKMPGILSILIFSIGALDLLGYAFGVPQFFEGIERPASVASSFSLVFLGAGISALAGQSRWPLVVFLSPTIVSQWLRIMIPLIIASLLGLSWIIIRVITPNFTEPVIYVLIFTVLIAVLVTLTTSRVSDKIQRTLNRAERERKNALDSLKLANDKLELLDSLTRHDILNQISLSMIEGELAKRQSSDPKVKESVENILKINKTIISLLHFSKEYKSVGIDRPRWLNLQEAISHSTAQLGLGKVAMDYYCEEWTVFADPMLEKAFFNIIENSLRHGEKVTKILIGCSQSGTDDSLKITFSDDGIGVPEGNKEMIFEKGIGKNTGLGLFLVRKILSITGITIIENGVPGKGARFEITVPKERFKATPEEH